MKWLFLVNNAAYLSEFFGKIALEAIKENDECLVVFNSKISEYDKKKFFPSNARFISQIDWAVKNYSEDKKDFDNLSWKQFFPNFYRLKGLVLNYKNSFKIVSQTYQFFDYIFEKERPDAVISEPPTGLFHQVAYYFCKKKNITYLGIGSSRLNNRIEICEEDPSHLKYEKTFNEINVSNISEDEKNFAKKFIQEFVSHEQVPSYMGEVKIYFSQIGLVWHYINRIKESGPLLLKCFFDKKFFKIFDYETRVVLNQMILAPFLSQQRKFKIFIQKSFFEEFKATGRFFLFPLQFQFEASTAVYAAYYSDQLNSIKNIAFSLPFPYKLYVKEHPVAVGTRPTSFYKELKKIPNVVLISPHESVEEIVKSSLGVITLTSTVGMESAMAGKLTYVLGDVFYSFHPLCKRLENFDDLKIAIEKDLINNPKIENLQDVNIRFVISYYRNTIVGDIGLVITNEDKNNYKLIYQCLKKLFFSYQR